MILQELITNLNKVKKEFGGEINVICATDDEGNGFSDIYSQPTPVKRLTNESNFTSSELEFEMENSQVNSIIIN